MLRPPNLTRTTPSLPPPNSPLDPPPPTDYLDFYGLSKPPFDEVSESTGYILFGSHRRAFELLIEHIVNGSGLVLLLGPEGIGKTETLRAAAAKSGRETILVSRPKDGRVSLNQVILALQGLPIVGPVPIADAIKRFQQPPRKVIIADDVELMPDDCITMLLSLGPAEPNATGAPTLIMSSSIELMGDPARPDLAQLSSLARDIIRMPPLAPTDIAQYIERRLWIVGGMTRRLISPDAMKFIVARAGGRPGSVNRLMEAAFTAGYARGDTMITAKTFAAATGASVPRSMPQRNAPEPTGRARLVLPILAVGLLAAGLFAFLYKAVTKPFTAPVALVVSPPVPELRPTPPPAPERKAEPPPVPKPVETLPPDVVAALIKRGNETFELGDISAARLLYQRAAAAGSATAATALGKTYDPAFSPSPNARDPARAAEWYQKAIALGDPKAGDLLKRLAPR